MTAELQMHCDQCEQTRKGTGCIQQGVCGKDPDMESLQKILLYGLKGMAAYKHHARRLGKTGPEVDAFIEEALFATMTNVNFDMDTLLGMVLECGRMNLKTMQLLNDGHVETFGTPEMTEVTEGIQEGPGILITGHDLVDLRDLLEQTKDTGIKVYTHGEMLPGHMYPKLKAYPHFAGHYGGAWQKQRLEFERFGGPVIASTNCVLIPGPKNTYGERLYTMRCTAVPGAKRLLEDDFSEVIQQAKAIGPLEPTETKTSLIGFHADQVMAVADKVIGAIKGGDVKHVFLIGGCDGAETGRNYFSEFAKATPEESLILTLGCGKYRIREHDYGTVAGLPRFLDMGQCNDAYSAIRVAGALAEELNCGINELPLTLVISWFEQKAVAVLLTLLALDVRNIRLGPRLPEFVTPNVLALLSERYGLQPIGTEPEADVQAAMAG